MVAHFDTSNSLPENLCFLLNQYLSDAISIDCIQNVSDSAHARFDALSRTYQYTISSVKNPFRYPYQYYIKGSLDLSQMNASAALLLEYEDFECFLKSILMLKRSFVKLRRLIGKAKKISIYLPSKPIVFCGIWFAPLSVH